MHLLRAQSGVIDDGGEAIDLGQSPGDVIFISAADTELACLSKAAPILQQSDLTLRLANFMQLGHNMSVDAYMDDIVRHAKLVVLRLLGGRSYWSYGLEQLSGTCSEHDVKLAVLPGDGQPDPELASVSTLPSQDVDRLWHYLIEGGAANAENFLHHCAHLLDKADAPPAPSPLLKSGLYWPDIANPSLQDIQRDWQAGAATAAIIFYRALLQGGSLAPVDALIDALHEQGLNALPVYVSSLKDDISAATLGQIFANAPPAVILNATGFAVSTPGADRQTSPLEIPGCPVLQTVFSNTSFDTWTDSMQGLSSRDLAMNVALPEVDGRILARAVSFKSDNAYDEQTQTHIMTYQPVADRVVFVAKLAHAWARLQTAKPDDRRVAIVLANYPNRDGRIGNGVGLDTPASTLELMKALLAGGYRIEDIPKNGDELISALVQGQTNRHDGTLRHSDATLSLADYQSFFDQFPKAVQTQITERWGSPEEDPHCGADGFHLAIKSYGNVIVGVQPARGYNIDPKSSYHDPDLVPPHGYMAFYAWLREILDAHAIIHNGKHGNLEWLPGKAVGLSETCFPETALGTLPHIYPFIVNDPGEGTQAKRRSSAVIIDHLTPPLTRAETYGPLKDLEAMVDEYYEASGLDPRRIAFLRDKILDLTQSTGLDIDCGIAKQDGADDALQKLDNYLCELKEMQIRNGLHIFGTSPQGELETDLLVALARVPRGLGKDGDASLIRALASDLGFTDFDPLNCALGSPWTGQKPDDLETILPNENWRTNGDTVERLELLAQQIVAGQLIPNPDWTSSKLVLEEIEQNIKPHLQASGQAELNGALRALDGRFVEPGPSGAPTRGRLDVLPTGRNFYSVDNRTVPTPAAWALGRKSAELLVQHFAQAHGNWPKQMGLSVWGTSNMRTGGDDIAQAMALIGAKPVWDKVSWRLTGYEIITLAELGRPRVDVTLRVSGFFRDAFPTQIDLYDNAIRDIAALDEEDDDDNPLAAKVRADAKELVQSGMAADKARRLASYRVFGSKPGAYGAGLQAMIDEKLWDDKKDLAEAYLAWGGYAYGAGTQGQAEHKQFAKRLSGIEAVVHNQDNREHDLLDSDDYYQFEGGMSVAIEHLSGTQPAAYHNDHSRPERPVIKTLEEEISRVMRARAVNPKWIKGVMRHGYKGAFEIAATVDYMFAFAATTGAVRDHHFELAYNAFVGDDKVRDFMAKANPAGLQEIAARFLEAMERGLWTAKSNAAHNVLREIAKA